jgi:hypothetical protein
MPPKYSGFQFGETGSLSVSASDVLWLQVLRTTRWVVRKIPQNQRLAGQRARAVSTVTPVDNEPKERFRDSKAWKWISRNLYHSARLHPAPPASSHLCRHEISVPSPSAILWEIVSPSRHRHRSISNVSAQEVRRQGGIPYGSETSYRHQW